MTLREHIGHLHEEAAERYNMYLIAHQSLLDCAGKPSQELIDQNYEAFRFWQSAQNLHSEFVSYVIQQNVNWDDEMKG
jgi:hypothetical protein